MHSLTLHKASTAMVLVSAGLDGLHPRRGGNPYSRVTISWMRRATSSLRPAVFAIPYSSIVSAMTAAL